MTHPAVARLRHLLLPPPSGGDVIDWEELARSVGLRLPTDYMEFVDLYGGGEIDEYLSISTPPVQGSPYGDLLDGVDPALPPEHRAQLASCIPSTEAPRLLPFGATASGDVAFWLIERAPDEWKVVVFRRQTPHGVNRWVLFDGGMVDFLCSFLSGALQPFSQRLPEEETHDYLGWRSG